MKVENVAKVQELGDENAQFDGGDFAADERRIIS